MSDVLIKNMDLSEERHIIITKKGEVLRTDYRGISMPTDSFAVEVEPHGRLKDFNEILTIFNKVICDVDDKTNALLCDLLVQIQYAPTVLEESE